MAMWCLIYATSSAFSFKFNKTGHLYHQEISKFLDFIFNFEEMCTNKYAYIYMTKIFSSIYVYKIIFLERVFYWLTIVFVKVSKYTRISKVGQCHFFVLLLVFFSCRSCLFKGLLFFVVFFLKEVFIEQNCWSRLPLSSFIFFKGV